MERIEGMLRDGELRSTSSSGNSTQDLAQHQAHVQEAMNQMSRNQNELLAAIKDGDREVQERLQVEYREREKAFKNASLIQYKLQNSLKARKVDQITEFTQCDVNRWPSLPKVTSNFTDRYMKLEEYSPETHVCYADLSEFERLKKEVTSGSLLTESNSYNEIKKTDENQPDELCVEEQDLFTISRPQEDPTTSITGDPMSEETLLELFKSIDKSGDGFLSSSELSSLWSSKEVPFDLPPSQQVLSGVFKYCGGYANRWKQIDRLSSDKGIPPLINFDEFCTIMLACAAR